MQLFTRIALKYSRFTCLCLLLIIVTGITAFLSLPRQEDPEITIRTANVVAYFPGMSPQRVEQLITKPLEKKINQIPEVDKIISDSKVGESNIKVIVHDRYFDLAPIWQDLRNKMKDVQKDLPKSTKGPFVNDDFGRVAIATIALTGEDFSFEELRIKAADIQDSLSQIPGISQVDLHGVQPQRVWLEVNQSRLAQYNITPMELAQALRQQNIVLPGGSINANGQTITIEPSGNFKTVSEIENVTIRVPGKPQLVYLRDIMQVNRGYLEPMHKSVFYNSKPSIVISVSMTAKFNIDKVGKHLRQSIQNLNDTLPVGMQLHYATFQPELVNQAVQGATHNLYQTIAIVLIVVMLFLGLRTGLVVGLIVPLTILATLSCMYLYGIDLQRMSIAAIIIALGLLVDNGIVMAEDMRRKMEHGFDKRKAALSAADSLALPLLVSSLTTILAFMPLMMAENITSEFLRSLSQVIAITLLASWFLAVAVTPALCYWLLPGNKAHPVAKQPQQDPANQIYYQGWYQRYRKFLELCLERKSVFILCLALVFTLSMGLLKFVPKQMMSPAERNQFLVYLDFPAGTDVRETLKVTKRLMSWLEDSEQNPNIMNHISYVGFGGPRFFLALQPPDPAANKAFLVVNTTSKEEVEPLMQKVDQYMKQNLPEARGRVKQLSLSITETGLVEYRVSGPSIITLQKIAETIEAGFRQIEGVGKIINDWENPVLKVKVHIDQVRAKRAGVSSEQIARALSGYLDGYAVTDLREGDQVIPIVIRGENDRDNLDRLRTLMIPLGDSKVVPLLQVANFVPSAMPSTIKHYNQQRTITISAKHTQLQAAELHRQMLPVLESLALDSDYTLSFGGEIEGSEQANAALFQYMPFAIMLMIILLVAQFNSFRRALIIILTIPLVLIGAIWGLWVTQAYLSFVAILGVFSLAGIIINNGIVLIDRIDQERSRVQELREAIINACVSRARPILMTTLTTILGLLPLVFFGDNLWFSMGIVIVFGLGVASVITLGFVPVMYSVLFSYLKPKH